MGIVMRNKKREEKMVPDRHRVSLTLMVVVAVVASPLVSTS
jgi:hypothetical protein